MNLLYIFIGGGIGSIARFLLSSHTVMKFEGSFISGIMVVNILGSLAIGLLAGLGFKNNDLLNPLLIIGFLGGFTTFSSFSLEAIHIFSSGKYLDAVLYILASVVFSLLGTFIGLRLTLAN